MHDAKTFHRDIRSQSTALTPSFYSRGGKDIDSESSVRKPASVLIDSYAIIDVKLQTAFPYFID